MQNEYILKNNTGQYGTVQEDFEMMEQHKRLKNKMLKIKLFFHGEFYLFRLFRFFQQILQSFVFHASKNIFVLSFSSVLLLLSSCMTASKTDEISVLLDKVKTGRFFQVNLSGGIPVVIKESTKDFEQISFAMIFQNDYSALNEKNAGAARIIFNSLFPDSQNSEVFSCFDSVNSDYFIFGFSCKKEIFSEKAESFLDEFFSAELTANSFARAVRECQLSLAQPSVLPELFMNQVRSQVFSGTPYAFSPYPTQLSLNSLTFEQAQEILQNLRVSSSMKIVSCGDFDEKSAASLILLLEKKIGKILSADSAPENKVHFEPEIKNTQTTELSESLLLGCFKCPQFSSDDYLAFAISTIIFDSILKNSPMLVEQNAISTGCGILPLHIPLGFISSMHSPSSETTLQALKDAIMQFPDKTELSRTLMPYKKHYARQLILAYNSSETELKSLVSSWIYFGNPAEYTSRIEKLNSVTAGQVCLAFQKYFVMQDIEWFILE